MEMKVLFRLCLWMVCGPELLVMAASSGSGERKIDQTPTWAVACVCAVMIIISVLLEKGPSQIWNQLMVVGFISLLLTFGQAYITKICIPQHVADTMLPCPADGVHDQTQEEQRRRLLWFEHRFLSDAQPCKTGYEPIISVKALHQLHILVFFLAAFHMVYSLTTVMLGRLKIRGWKEWEQETSSHDYEFSNDLSRFMLAHETSFVKAHTSFWTRIPFFFYIGCFFRQFFRSVIKADYLTLRHGFIAVHLAPGNKFNFQKYIKRSLEDDFKLIVGVSPILWASFVIVLLLNVEGWHGVLWFSMVPVIIIFAVGTKLQAILTKMALEIEERHAVVQGMPLVQGSDKYFWFGRPQLVLHLIHFALFQNAFQVTYFLWIWYSFGLRSCFHMYFGLVMLRIAVGVGVLFLCSYITLPLYALVTQMGSNMKKSIFEEQTSNAPKNWHMAAKKRHKKGGKSPTTNLDGSKSASPASSGRTLHRFKTTGRHSTSSHGFENQEMSDMEAETLASSSTANNRILRSSEDDEAAELSEAHHHHKEETSKEGDFSFIKPAVNHNWQPLCIIYA